MRRRQRSYECSQLGQYMYVAFLSIIANWYFGLTASFFNNTDYSPDLHYKCGNRIICVKYVCFKRTLILTNEA